MTKIDFIEGACVICGKDRDLTRDDQGFEVAVGQLVCVDHYACDPDNWRTYDNGSDLN